MHIEIPNALTAHDRNAIEGLLNIIGTNEPTLEQIWMCIDAVWDQLGCDNRNVDLEKIEAFYRHPVWLLNGLFIEQHSESLRNREIVSNWIAQRGAERIADFGGGFGTLARMVAAKCPEADVEVIEPYPHPLAVAKAEKFANVLYRKTPSGAYDMIVAMDVFEHLPDPLRMVSETAHYLKRGGIYLAANCFYPVIKCHLPVTFHFRRSWNLAMSMMSLRPMEAVGYGFAFQKSGNGGLRGARVVEAISRLSFSAMETSRAARSQLKLGTRLRSSIANLISMSD